MGEYNVAPLENLVDKFEMLPGIGRKTAQRLAYFVLNLPEEKAKSFSDAILEAHSKIKYCKICKNITDDEICSICKNTGRDKSIICVVEEPRDVMALERIGNIDASYHVLHGAISPMNGIGPDQIYIKELLNRIEKENVIIDPELKGYRCQSINGKMHCPIINNKDHSSTFVPIDLIILHDIAPEVIVLQEGFILNQ